MKTNTFQEKLEEIKRQVWDAATLNKYNPLGHRLLDAHFTAITDLVLNDVIKVPHQSGGERYLIGTTDGYIAATAWDESADRLIKKQRAIIKGATMKTNTNTELYDVFAGNGHRLIARGVAYEKAEQIARDFVLRCARDGVEVPKSNIVKQQASLNTEGVDNE